MGANKGVLEREKRTIREMVHLYCRGNHGKSLAICEQCAALTKAACERIDTCPYNDARKPVCGLCPANCFPPQMHRSFHKIMRYAGPRMLLKHPLLSAAHFLDAVRWKLGR